MKLLPFLFLAPTLLTAEPPVFPALIPTEKPDYPVSAAVARLYDEWNPHEDRANELYSNFKYSPIDGLPLSPNISRRDPTKILKIDGVYHIWYTHRETEQPPAGADKATDTIPSTDWDLAEIWHATSKDGFTWEEQGPAVKRLPKPGYGWRSISTPDVLVWKGKYYMYYQAFNAAPGGKRGDRAAVTAAVADSPSGPWKPTGKPLLDFGGPDDWDSNAIHDPYPIVFKGKIHFFYKGSPGKAGRDGTLVRAQGLATADHPLGPFTKCPINPVINSGHETCAFPWKDGLAAIVSLDGPEKNTVQYSPDGINWTVKSLIQVPPIAPGPFIPDAYADNGDGRGITWGLSHVMNKPADAPAHSVLVRFDCDLSLDVDRPLFKNNNLRFNEATYLQRGIGLDPWLRKQIENPTAPKLLAIDPKAFALFPATPGAGPTPFPGVVPMKKPDMSLSAAMTRLYDKWNPHEDRANELYSNFKYSRLEGLPAQANVSRRDPTKVIKVGDVYHVWYTCRRSNGPPVGIKNATDTAPGTDWDLADIWHATSKDGFTWIEEGLAVKRPPAPEPGSRSICTPGILAWKEKFYLYFQAYAPMVGGQANCPVRVAWADSPNGPWTHHPDPVILPGPEGSWNNIKINDPCPVVHKGKILIYYKGAPIERGPEYVLRMQGVSFADNPLGPFTPSPLNPVINSGHETCMFPFMNGVAALVALDGPEKNTIQWSPDGENFEIRSMIQVPPIAPGPYCPDAFSNSGDGRGFTWGLCHINPDGGGASNESILARFDCDLSLDVDHQILKRNNLRFNLATYFQKGIALPEFMKRQILSEQKKLDRETMLQN